jgi:hypothetical protein
MFYQINLLQQEATCVLCDQQDETTDHLLASCSFTREFWQRLLARAGMQHLGPNLDSRLADWWQQTRSDIPGSLQRGFDSLALLVSWAV